MTDVLRIAHPQNCPPYGNFRVGICEGNLLLYIDCLLLYPAVKYLSICIQYIIYCPSGAAKQERIHCLVCRSELVGCGLSGLILLLFEIGWTRSGLEFGNPSFFLPKFDKMGFDQLYLGLSWLFYFVNQKDWHCNFTFSAFQRCNLGNTYPGTNMRQLQPKMPRLVVQLFSFQSWRGMNERFEWKSFVGRNLSRKEMLTPAKIGVDNTKCIYVPQPPHLSQKKTFMNYL